MSDSVLGLIVGLVFLVLLSVVVIDAFRRWSVVEGWGSLLVGVVAVVLVVYSLAGLRFV